MIKCFGYVLVSVFLFPSGPSSPQTKLHARLTYADVTARRTQRFK